MARVHSQRVQLGRFLKTSTLSLTLAQPRQALKQAENEYAEQNPEEVEEEEEEEEGEVKAHCSVIPRECTFFLPHCPNGLVLVCHTTFEQEGRVRVRVRRTAA